MIDKFKIQQLRNLDIEGVAARLGLTVRRHTSLCPFHDDTRPSLTFNRRTNTFRCYVCDAFGGPIDLVMHRLHKNFYEACLWLADENNIIVEQYKPEQTHADRPSVVDVGYLSQLICQPVLIPEARQFLFEERRLRPEVIAQLGITSICCPVPMSRNVNGGWFNAPSLLIPYRDADGRLLSVQARYLGTPPKQGERGQSHPRFQFPKGSSCSVFNLDIIKTLKGKEPLFIAEGVTDCLAYLSAGSKAIAIPSATLLKPDDVEAITRPLREGWEGTYQIYPDRDAPGERLFLDLKQMLEATTTDAGRRPTLERNQLPEGFKDIGQLYAYLHRQDPR